MNIEDAESGQSPRSHPLYPATLGAIYRGNSQCTFCVWAPKVQRVEVHLVEQDRFLEMTPGERGYFELRQSGIEPGTRYQYRLNGEHSFPDPASKHQPDGVHEPSQVVADDYPWQDSHWRGLPLSDYILYEFHVGTFTSEGTFDAVIPHLDELQELGITAVEPLPLAQFPGDRNWGYDGVHPFAVQNTYGGPEGFKRLVDACHARGIAVVVDVVYNHLGPEGNYLGQFGHYFSHTHLTPWGEAINFDGPHSDEVRRFFIENALYWVREFHVDALRLDAVHAIYDQRAYPFLRELGEAVHVEAEILNRRVHVIAESNLNEPRMVRPVALGGMGLDAQWVDDVHHALHVALTGERAGYYEDFHGVSDLAASLEKGFVYTGQYSRFRIRRHGQPSSDLPAESFVVCSQNHDQVGNRMLGDRMTALANYEQLKLAAGVVLLSPYVPLLFMGEEYGETAPFQFFTSHGDRDLIKAVREGRKEEFARFRWQEEPPDPQAPETFERCKLNHELKQQGHHARLLNLYRELIRLRKTVPALAQLDKQCMRSFYNADDQVIGFHRWATGSEIFAAFHFGEQNVTTNVPLPAGDWRLTLDSAAAAWDGPGAVAPGEIASSGKSALPLAPHSFVLFTQERQT